MKNKYNIFSCVMLIWAVNITTSFATEKKALLQEEKMNVLLIISNNLATTALSCYGNTVYQTPNIDAIADRGVRFTRAYCQGTYCGPSRESLLSGYYPYASEVSGYTNLRLKIGERPTWPQLFKNTGYYSARISKVFHMQIPTDIEAGTDGFDDPISWTERFNSQGPEWQAPGVGETLENNPDGDRPVVGGNTFVVVEAEGDDMVHSDGKTAAKAVELIKQYKDEPFFIAVGFVRPHVPFVAPADYFIPFLPYDNMVLPEKREGDWNDIPDAGINYKTSENMNMDIRKQKKAIGGYYATVSYMDAQVGKVMGALKEAGLEEKTIVIFTSDNGFHLGEHDFWAMVSLREESSAVPLIISVPGKEPAVCNSLTELLDLYPTVASLCGLKAPDGLQGKDISPMLDDPTYKVRSAAFSVAPLRQGYLLREEKYAYIQYMEDASSGIELFDMTNDPQQFTNLAELPEYAITIADFKEKLATKMTEVKNNNLEEPLPPKENTGTTSISLATNITTSTARLNGSVISTGGEDPTVRIFWGTTDAGTTWDWDHQKYLGVRGAGDFYFYTTGLIPGTRYYYRANAVNAAGTTWTAAAETFVTASIPTVTLTVSGNHGTIAKSPDLHGYALGTEVTLTPIPDTGYHFIGWSGEVTSAVNPLVTTMNSTQTFTANFAINKYTLNITAENGTVSKSLFQETYTHGTEVTLTAVPAEGYYFSEWSGDSTSAANPLVIAMDSTQTLTANFAIKKEKMNVLLIISDDLTATALSCYGNTVCQTPNIDAIADRGVRFTRAYCQGTYCGPSRESLLSGYYPYASEVSGYDVRLKIGDRATWPQLFKNNGYYSARISKVFHMQIPTDIEAGTNGHDDPISWTERFNSQGPEWQAPGVGETLENNPDGDRPVVGGNTFVVVEAEGNDLVHSDGKTAAKAVELIRRYKEGRFFLAVGFVRPHVPFVAPADYFTPFLPYDNMVLPEKLEGDWNDIPDAGINYKTSENMYMDIRKQKKAMGGYYAAVSYMDAQVGKVMGALKEAGLEEKTIVIFIGDNGFHLGEHDFWAKVSLRDESAAVPLIISMPGKEPAVCNSLTELLDLYPTVASLCGLKAPEGIQGKDISLMLDDPTHKVRDAAFSVAPMREGFLLREEKWVYIQYKEDASGGIELFDMTKDPKQFTNLAELPEYATMVEEFKEKLATKMREVRNNDLGEPLPPKPQMSTSSIWVVR